MSYNFNIRALKHSTARSAQGWEELPDEDTASTDIARGTSLLHNEDIAAAEDSEDEELCELLSPSEAPEVRAAEERADVASLYRAEQEEKREARAEVARSEEERTHAFMVQWITQHPVPLRGYRFTGPKESELQTALITAQLRIQVMDMIKRIREHTSHAPALAEEAQD